MKHLNIEQHILEILDIARFAPSVHNAQPWLITLDGGVMSVAIDPEHELKDGDPTGRETIISLGIFCEAVSIAADSIGLKADTVTLDGRVAHVTFTSSTPRHADLVTLLFSRCSDRSIYKPTVVSPKTLARISNARKHPKVKIITRTDTDLLKKVAHLTSKGIQLAMSSPSFRKELSEYLVVPGSRKKRGIATKSLYLSGLLEMVEPLFVRSGIGISAEVKLEKRRWESASAVVFICSDGDMPADWFEAGRSYLHASLAIEETGLSQATSAAIVEASNFHEDVEALLMTKQRIQAILRIGKGKDNRHKSPRVDASELLATSN